MRGPGRFRPSSGPAEPGDPTSNPESKRLARGSCQALISLTFKGNDLPSRRRVGGQGPGLSQAAPWQVAAAGFPELGDGWPPAVVVSPPAVQQGASGWLPPCDLGHTEHAGGLSACGLRSWRRAASFTQ